MKFEAIVRKQGGLMEVGKINSLKLLPFVGKKVVVIVKEKGEIE
jgi:hypothetical protein